MRMCSNPFQVLMAAAMVLAAVSPARAEKRGDSAGSTAPRLPDLPVGIASFGAALEGDWLYVYGGHTGETHSYSIDEVSNAFRRVNVRTGGAWEDLPTGPALQGLPLVTHGGYIYRIGGMKALNKQGDADDLESVADVARFDPRSRQWTAMAPLPVGRSSHGAVVVDGQLYVAGGWQLRHDQKPLWHTTALVLDLNAQRPQWKELPKQPFERRALALEAAGGKLLVTGGLIPGGMSGQTDLFDLKTQTWSQGPTIPGSRLNAIGMAACSLDGRIYVNGLDGTILSLDPAGGTWRPAGKLDPARFHHHLFALGPDELLTVGGATRSDKVLSVARIELHGASPKQ